MKNTNDDYQFREDSRNEDRDTDYDEDEGQCWQVGLDMVKDTVKDILYSVLNRHDKSKDKGQDC